MYQFAGCASATDNSIKNASDAQNEAGAESVQTENSMMIPEHALKSPNGYAYIRLVDGSDVKPSMNDAVNLKIRVLDFEGQVMDEGAGTVAMAHSTPFFEEMLPLMTVGETIRVWGESESRIWEITLLSIDEKFSAPEDVGHYPESAQKLDGFEDIYWRMVDSAGNSGKIREGAVLRIHGSRWKSNGEILESNLDGRGMMLFMDDTQKQSDPVHHALFLEMAPGDHVRIWIPSKYEQTDFDVVEDFWLTERLEQLETPKNLHAPEKLEESVVLDEKVYLQFIDKKHESLLKDGDAAEVDMVCWNKETGMIVDASYIRDKHDIMDISAELGIWEKIMTSAGRGDTFMVWIDKDKLPESVQVGLTCRVRVF